MIVVKAAEMFFDRKAVMRAVDRARRASLSKGGAYVRQAARTSIRKRSKSSDPGEPPHSHVGTLRRGILFGYDRFTDSVVVGPAGIAGSRVPAVLEHGGKTVIYSRDRKTGRLKSRVVHIRPRPHMDPALERTADELPDLWEGSVKP